LSLQTIQVTGALVGAIGLEVGRTGALVGAIGVGEVLDS